MKKLLTALVALLGFASVASALPFSGGTPYRLKHKASGLYMHMEIDGRGDNSGKHCASLEDENDASIIYFVQKPGDSTQWQIHVNSPEGPNLSSDGTWHSIINSTDGYYWTVTETSETNGEFVITRTGTATNTENLLGPNLNAAAETAALWTNQDGNNANKFEYCKWTVELMPVYPVTVTYTIRGEQLTYQIGFAQAGSNYTMPDGQGIVTITGGPSSTVQGPIELSATLNDGDAGLFKIVSGRDKNNWVVSNSTSIAATGRNHTYAEGAYFVEVPIGNDNFKIFDIAHIGFLKDLVWTNNSDEATVFAISRSLVETQNGAQKPYGCEFIENTGKSSNKCLNLSGGQGTTLAWYWNDFGSAWFMVYDNEVFQSNLAAYPEHTLSSNNTYQLNYNGNPYYQSVTRAQSLYDARVAAGAENLEKLKAALDAVKAARFGRDNVVQLLNTLDEEVGLVGLSAIRSNAENLISLGIVSDEAIQVWHSATDDITTYSEGNVNALVAAYQALAASTATKTNSVYVNIKTNHPNHSYIGLNPSTNGLWVNADEGHRAFKIVGTETGGFVLYNEFANKYIKHASGLNQNFSLVSASEDATVYQLDLTADAAEYGRYGIKSVEPKKVGNQDMSYLHYNGWTGNEPIHPVFGWQSGDNSSWYLEMIGEDAAASDYLAGALHNSETIPESSTEVGFLALNPEVIAAARSAAEQVAEDADAATKREAADAVYNALATMIVNQPKHGEIYTITSAEICDNRGSLYYNAEKGDYVWTTVKTAKPEGSAETVDQWIVYKDGENTYLYNIAAQKFANAFGLKDHKDVPAVKYAWMFGDVPTPVVFNGDIFEQPESKTRPFVIEGGEDTSDKHRPGMMIINGISTDMTPVIAVAGWGDEKDGTGFEFVKIGDASDEDMAAIAAAIANIDDNAAAAKATADALIDSEREAEELANIVGYYSLEDINKYNETMNLIAEDSSADKVYGISVCAAKGVEKATISYEMVSDYVYTIETSTGLKYHGVNGVPSTAEFTTADGEDHENAYNWRATVEGIYVSLTHKNNGEKVKFLVGNSDVFTVSAGSMVGQVVLTPFVGETTEPEPELVALSDEEVAAPAVEYILTSLGADASDSTTGIEEVTMDATEGVQTVYDLQGRRLSAPVKGINIINGKKVLVK